MKKAIRYVIYAILFAVIIFLFIYIGTYDFKNKNLKDNDIVASKFSYINSDNKYYMADIGDINKILDGSGAILLANPSNVWADKYASVLNEAALKTGIKKIAVCDITIDRIQNSKKYQNLLKKLDQYVIYDDLGKGHIYMPTFILVKDKKIIYIDNETSQTLKTDAVDTYWSDDAKSNKINIFVEKINEYLEVDSNE